MNILNFAVSIVLLICAVGMTLGALFTPSHYRIVSVVVFSFMSCLSAGLVVTTYKELKDLVD